MRDGEWRFINAFKIPCMAMYVNRSHPFIDKNKFWFFQFLSITVVNATCLICLCHSILLHDIKNGHYAEASKNGTMLVICVNSNIKYYTLLYCRESYTNLIDTIDRDYETATKFDKAEKEIVVSYSKKSSFVCKVWMMISFGSGSVFPIKAFILMAYSYSVGRPQLIPMFDLTYPYFLDRYKDTPVIFCGLFLLTFFFDCYSCITYTSFEPLVPIFTLHACGQLELLSMRMRNLFKSANNFDDVHAKLRGINIKLQELYKFIGQVQDNSIILMEFNMKTTAIVLPFIAFQIVEDLRERGVFNVEFVILFFATIAHFLSPCYFCDMLISMSEKFRHTIYTCQWESNRDVTVQKTILLMITRTTSHLRIKTVFNEINLEAFAAMCRQAYGIFNLMNAACA